MKAFIILLVFISTMATAGGIEKQLISPVNPDTAGEILRHNVKWNFSLVGRGVFIFDYEMRLSKKVTATLGVGITSRDLIFELTKRAFQNNNGMGGNAKGGFACEGGIRLYPINHNNFKGFFLQPTFSYREYRLSNREVPVNYYYPSYYPANYSPSYKLNDYELRMGYQFKAASYMRIELYSGFAYRFSSYKVLETVIDYTTVTVYDPNNPYTYTQPVYIQRPKKVTEYNMRPLFGMQLGFTF